MRPMPGNFRSIPYLWSLLLLIFLSSTALAGSDYGNKDFSVRLPPAFLRFTEISVLGGETVANKFSSAINPASLGWTSLPGKNGILISPYYSFISFKEGMHLNIFGESMTWDTRKWGAFQPTGDWHHCLELPVHPSLHCRFARPLRATSLIKNPAGKIRYKWSQNSFDMKRRNS